MATKVTLPEAATQYDFNRAYKVKLLAMIMQVRGFLNRFRPVISASYFGQSVLADVCQQALDYYDSRRATPTIDAIENAVADLCARDKRRAKLREAYADLFTELRQATFEERADIEERVIAFAKNSAYLAALAASLDDIQERGDTSTIRKRMLDAELVGSEAEAIGVDVLSDLSAHAWSRVESALSTGFDVLDGYLGGGLAVGELGVIEAPPGRFKTTTLVNFARNGIYAGADVVYFSLEVGENPLTQRIASGLFDNYRDFKNDSAVLQEKLSALRERLRGRNLLVKRYAPDTATPAMLRAHLYRLAALGKIQPGIRPLLIVVDYAALLRSERSYRDKRHEQRDNYQACLQLGAEFDATVWTGIQATRGSMDKKIIDMNDLAECFAVAADADVIISLNQTQQEKKAKIIRAFLAKVREAVSWNTVEFSVDPSRALLVERTIKRRVRQA